MPESKVNWVEVLVAALIGAGLGVIAVVALTYLWIIQ